MNNSDQQAATRLLNNRQYNQSMQRLPRKLRPTTSEQALQIQTKIINNRSDGVAAWKCSLPLNAEQLIVAPIFTDTVHKGHFCSLFADGGKARIEPEIAFVLGADLPANAEGYNETEIDDAVKGCFMALELIQDRFHGEKLVSFYEKLADCLSNQGLYIGPEIDRKKAYLSSEFEINVQQKNNNQRFAGKHQNELPQKALYWVINFMSKRGVAFKAGQAIITGSYAGVVEVDFNATTTVNYEGLGKYQVTFDEKIKN